MNNAEADLQDICAQALEAVDFGVFVFDSRQRIVLWNEWMVKHSSPAHENVLGLTFRNLFSNLLEGRVHRAIHSALHDNIPALLSQALNRAPLPLYASAQDAAIDKRIQQSIRITPIQIEGASNYCMVQVKDVSDAVAYEKVLREQSIELRSKTMLDELTGISNKLRFDDYLFEEFHRAKRNGNALALIMIDIDDFKRYNEHYGSPEGDRCLIRIAKALTEVAKRPADIVVRYGGEEFAMILPDTDQVGAQKVAESARARIESLNIRHERSRAADHVTVSIGVVGKKLERSDDISGLIAAVDRALYMAKFSGRNRVAWY